MYLVPGVVTVVLALLAAIVSLQAISKWIEDRPWRRVVGISVFVLIAAWEIINIHHADIAATNDRQNLDKAHLKELRDQQDRFGNEMVFLSSFKDSVADEFKNVNARIAKAKSQMPIPDSLKVETLVLAKDFFQFAMDVEKYRPPSVGSSREEQENTSSPRWRARTILRYVETFESRLNVLTRKLTERGLNTQRLESMCMKPDSPLIIGACGNELQELANKLP